MAARTDRLRGIFLPFTSACSNEILREFGSAARTSPTNMVPSAMVTPPGRATAATTRALTGSPALAFFAFTVLSNSACTNCLCCANDDNGKQPAATIAISQIFIIILLVLARRWRACQRAIAFTLDLGFVH